VKWIVTDSQTSSEASTDDKPQPAHRVRLPGFVGPGEDVGLGDVIKRTTSLVGVKPCVACDQRRRAVNGWLVFNSGRRRR
jgi:hypothetical protein